MLAIIGMLVFLYIDSAEKLNEVGISAKSDDPPPERSEIVEVIDSSTVKLASGHKVRYLGVRMPNVKERVECYGKEALAMNESVIGKVVRMESDPILERAEDGAWLRYVFTPEAEKENNSDDEPVSGTVAPINEGSELSDIESELIADELTAIESVEPIAVAGDDVSVGDSVNEVSEDKEEIDEYMINERIIEMGAGFPLLAENMIHFERMASGMKYSRATEKGLWGACEIEAPEEGGLPQTNVIEECIIKGKVLMNGDKVYREPGCAAYGNTVVLQYSKGDAWLCSKEEAEEGGWVRAKDCG